MLTNAPIPPGMKVLHECDVRHCCNPEHLFLGSSQDNSDDMVAKGRSTLGERNPGSKLIEDDVRAIRRKASRGATQQELADSYGVGRTSVGNIIHRRKWANVV